jgi:hypothetical protein
MTASRARNSDIGSERENSRIGARRTFVLPAGLAGALPDEFLRAMIDRSHPLPDWIFRNAFALQQTSVPFDPIHLTC